MAIFALLEAKNFILMAENGQIRTHWSCFTVGLSDKQFVRPTSGVHLVYGVDWTGLTLETIHRFVSRSVIMLDCREESTTCGPSTTVTRTHCLLVRLEFYRNKIRPLINDCYH